MSVIFISYRRQDAAGHAGRLRDELVQRYGVDRVFFDMADIAPGASWAEQLHAAVARCKVMLVVMGPQWISATDASGHRRLDDPADFIRTEVAGALRGDKRVVPVLVGGAGIPQPDELPDVLQPLMRRQCFELSDRYWEASMQSLLGVLDLLLGNVPPRGPAQATQPAPRAQPFMARLARAFQVLLGRDASPASHTFDAGPSVASVTRSQHATDPQERPPRAAQPKGTDRAPRSGGRSTRPAKPLPAPGPAVAPAAGRVHTVFVSHASEDRSVVERVVQAIEAAAQPCWVAFRDIPAGDPAWAEPIVTAIAGSKLVLVLITEHAVGSIEVLREVTLAADEKIPLLPACLDATPLSPGLRYFFVAGQRLNLAGLPVEDQLAQIVPALTLRLPGDAAA